LGKGDSLKRVGKDREFEKELVYLGLNGAESKKK
jgi:hypothetical protein